MSEVAEFWRDVHAESKRWKDSKEQYRVERLFKMLEDFDEIILLRELGPYGYRLMHFEWPQSHYVDYWPRTGAIRYQGETHKGWIKLLKILGIRKRWKPR